MCGIVAFFSPRSSVSPDALRNAVAVLRHRGPDNQRQWVSSDRRVALGHARLSLLDLPGGDQPLTGEDGQIRLIVNGEFYDFERIRRTLELRHHCFKTKSDSEIALHLYEDLGVDCLSELRGEFAFVLWDAANQTLFAARDRFGIKPLYYASHRDTLYIASEAKALFAAGVPAAWDEESLYHRGMGLPDRTLFRGVFQVPPGHYILATPQGFRLSRYWDFDYPPAEQIRPAGGDDRHYIEKFHATLDEAVKLRLRSDVPVGCYLSGGLDSSAVLGLASRHAREPIHAFTLTFEQADYDESAIARGMAEHVGAIFHPVPVKQSDIADHFANAIWHAETLFLNGHGVAKFLLSRAARDVGHKAVLTGEGADEILGGYAHFQQDMKVKLDDNSAASRPKPAGPDFDTMRRALGFVPTWFRVFKTVAARDRGLLADEFRRRHSENSQLFLSQLDVPGQLRGRDPLNQAQYLWSKSVLPNYILVVLGDRMEMAHSIEGRVPFLDHHVVELLRAVPVGLKIRGNTEKYLLREAARPVITDTIYRRKKHALHSPPAASGRADRFHELMQDTLRGPALAAMPYYEQTKITAALDALPAMAHEARMAMDSALTAILSACILQQQFKLGTP
jgi:asparagine synthase (glutamine-hydrolysing)